MRVHRQKFRTFEPAQYSGFLSKTRLAAMTRKRENSSVEYRNLNMFSSVVLLPLQQEYIFHPQEIKKTRVPKEQVL